MVEKFSRTIFMNFRTAIIELIREIQFIDQEKAENIYEFIKNNQNQYQDFSFFFFIDKQLKALLFARPVIGLDLIGRSIEIEYIAVHGENKRSGLGKTLIEYLYSHVKWSFDNLYLGCFEDNYEGHKFYSKLGFVPYRINGKIQTKTIDKSTALEHSDILLIKKMPLRNVSFRPIRKSDAEFLKEMVFQSLYSDGKSLQRTILEEKEIKKYYFNWDDLKDIGYIARYNQTDIGAVWCRFFPYYDQGFGYIDEDIPEMGIALLEKFRNRGVGQKLLDHLFNRLKHLGIESVSLSTHQNNPAVRLYRKNQFEDYSIHGHSITMIKKF